MMLPSNDDYIDTLVSRFTHDLEQCQAIHKAVTETPIGIINFTFNHSRYSLLKSEEEMIHDIKKHYWREVFDRSNITDILSHEQRRKIIDSFEIPGLPEFNRENVQTTLRQWYEDAPLNFAQKVNLVFEKLSGEHVTNQPQGFTKKIIYKNLVDYSWFPKTFDMYNFKEYGIDIIHDLRTAIQILYKLPISTRHDTSLMLETINERNEYQDFDNGAFKVKVFKNGNSHIELHPHVAVLLNCELARLYPNAIPAPHRTVTPEIKEYTFEYTHFSERFKRSLREFIIYGDVTTNYKDGSTTIKFKRKHTIGTEFKELMQFLEITEVAEAFEYHSKHDITEMLRHVITNGVVDYKSNQYYPTPEEIAEDLEEIIGDATGKRILEPSAGRGRLADRFKQYKIHCIEKESLNAMILSSKHENVICGDFLFYNVTKSKDLYDIIVMNPPYNNKQWKTHTEHALKCLKPGGVIYAVLPQGKQHDFDNCEVLATYENMFDNTSVTTCIYKITK